MKRYFLRSAVSRGSRRTVTFAKKKSGTRRPTSQYKLGQKRSTTRRRLVRSSPVWNCVNISPLMCKYFTSVMTLLLFTGAIAMVVLYFHKEEKPDAVSVIREFMILQNESFKGKSDAEIIDGVQHLAQYLSQLKSRSDTIDNATDDIIAKFLWGWKPFSGSLYYFSHSLLPFVHANLTCSRQRGHLVDILTPMEEKYVEDEVAKQDDKFYIGLKKEGNRWQWVSGKPLTTSYWGETEEGGTKGDCAVIFKCGTQTKCWENTDCSQFKKWICKLNSNPEYL